MKKICRIKYKRYFIPQTCSNNYIHQRNGGVCCIGYSRDNKVQNMDFKKNLQINRSLLKHVWYSLRNNILKIPPLTPSAKFFVKSFVTRIFFLNNSLNIKRAKLFRMKFPVRILPHVRLNFVQKQKISLQREESNYFCYLTLFFLLNFIRITFLEISKRINLLWEISVCWATNPIIYSKLEKGGIFSTSCSKTNLLKLELFQNLCLRIGLFVFHSTSNVVSV